MALSYAVFSARYKPWTGGVEAFTERLAHELVCQGDAVTVVTSDLGGAPKDETQDDGVHVLRLPSTSLLSGRLPVVKRGEETDRLLDLVRSSGIDRILINTRFYELSVLGLEFASELGVPAVVLDHGSDWLTLGNSVADAAIRVHERAITRRGRACRPRYAGISAKSAAWLQTFGIVTNTVIPNAIDADDFRGLASPRDFRDELDVSSKQALVAFCGRLTQEKGALELAQAAAGLGDSCILAMAGSGHLEKPIRSIGARNVRLLGTLATCDVSALLRDADLLCLPSRSEGFSTTLLEAGAWGTACLTTRVGGSKEVLGDPCSHGAYLSGWDLGSVASGLAGVLRFGRPTKSKELAMHVRRDLCWEKTLEALDNAYL